MFFPECGGIIIAVQTVLILEVLYSIGCVAIRAFYDMRVPGCFLFESAKGVQDLPAFGMKMLAAAGAVTQAVMLSDIGSSKCYDVLAHAVLLSVWRGVAVGEMMKLHACSLPHFATACKVKRMVPVCYCRRVPEGTMPWDLNN